MSDIAEGSAVPGSDKDSKHDEMEIKIIDVKDANGTSIKDGAVEFDTRKYAEKDGKKSSIEFEVKNQEGCVEISIEVESPDFAKEYYKNVPVNTIAGPIKANYYFEYYAPGKHTFEWDGRGMDFGERLLIEGKYKIVIGGICPQCLEIVKDECTFTVKKAYAHCYGATYPNPPFPPPLNLSGPANHMRSKLETLSDSSHFKTGGSKNSSAHYAKKDLKNLSAIFFWVGHGNKGIICFYHTALHRTCIASTVPVGSLYVTSNADVAAINNLGSHSLDNVFLVILLGCHTSENPAGAPSLPGVLINKGVDLVIGFKGEIYVRSLLKWTRDFFHCVNKNIGIYKSALRAKALANPADKPNIHIRMFKGGKSNFNDKLIPARYGTKKT